MTGVLLTMVHLLHKHQQIIGYDPLHRWGGSSAPPHRSGLPGSRGQGSIICRADEAGRSSGCAACWHHWLLGSTSCMALTHKPSKGLLVWRQGFACNNWFLQSVMPAGSTARWGPWGMQPSTAASASLLTQPSGASGAKRALHLLHADTSGRGFKSCLW